MDMLAGELTTLAFCWRVERRDGVAIGLTSHDRDLAIDGLRHRAAPGMTPSAVRREIGLGPDTMDVAGALTADAIGAADLLAGRWDGARVTLFAVDWTGAPGRVALGEGTIGAVSLTAGQFTAELKGPAAALARAVTEPCAPECRAELGDRRCRVPMAGRRRFARVVSVAGPAVTVDAGEPSPNAYGDGRLRWIGGANAGLESAVLGSAGAAVTLRAPPAFMVEPGALVELVEGCDKRLATCAGRFGNALNFRGEPYLPGVDLLTRYPGQ
ncbi:DUF2163 domain-containing protein [uncultured Sphingomonas sp.]|uniref:DUF2163 domain-containing protein n=1 Tax=uncultured Sphingomonas sp. TaxID=158754 RepID=UPI0035CA45F8